MLLLIISKANDHIFPPCTFRKTSPKMKTGDLLSKEIDQSTYGGQGLGANILFWHKTGVSMVTGKPVYSPFMQGKLKCVG